MRHHFVFCCGLFAAACSVVTSPPRRCVTANLSAGGTVLVLNDLTYSSADSTKPRHVATSTFRVFQRNDPKADRFRISDSEVVWSEPVWSIVADAKSVRSLSCNRVLATDDACEQSAAPMERKHVSKTTHPPASASSPAFPGPGGS